MAAAEPESIHQAMEVAGLGMLRGTHFSRVTAEGQVQRVGGLPAPEDFSDAAAAL
jgi:hypothetical protein